MSFKYNNNNMKSTIKMENYITNETSNLKAKLIEYFRDKSIYCEIFNGNINISQTFYLKLSEYKANLYKRLSKNIDYIVFQDGHLKTKRFAVLNDIKLVNPLWIDDKISKGIFEDDSKYFIKVNFIGLAPFYKNLNEKEEKRKSYNKKFDEKYLDEFDIKFNKYIDSKMESVKSQKYKDNSNIKDELYYPLFDVRQKRKSTDIIKYFNTHIDYSHKNENSFQTSSKKINIIPTKRKNCKTKSSDNIKKQTIIEIKDNKLKIVKNNITPKKILKLKDNNLSSENFNNNNKINIYSYNCDKEILKSIENLKYFEYKKEIIDNLNEFNKKKDLLIVDLNDNKYNYKLYQYIFDKFLLVDIYEFLLEFINEKYTNSLFTNKALIIKKLEKILLTNNLNIIKNKTNNINIFFDNNKNNYYILCKNINTEEYNILKTMLTYLKANILDDNFDHSKSIKNCHSQKDLFFKKQNKKNIIYIPDMNNKNTYLISKNKNSILNLTFKNHDIDAIINTFYVYDSFINGSLINLSNENNLIKYKLDN